jgi:DNA-binding NtrC family response regulator
MKILLVDDEEKFATALAKRLNLRGIDTDFSFTCEDAIVKAGLNKYDVAVLDVKMPGIGGIELRRKLNKLDPALKFIFLTGHGSDNDFELGSAEASFYLVKPLKIEEFIQAIYRAADKNTGSRGKT